VTLRYGFLSFLALATIVLLAIENYEKWTMPLQVVSEKAGARKSGIKPESSRPSGSQLDAQKNPSPASSVPAYVSIAEKNPFHPDRKEFPVIPPPEVPKPAEVKKPIVRPQVTLYGVMIVGDYQSATISYPGRPLQKGEREAVTLRIGDKVGDYKLSEILPDRIGLETPEDKFQVFLYDTGTPKKRVYAKTENKPATTTSTVAGAPGTGAEAAKPAPGAAPRPSTGAAPTPPPPAVGPAPAPTAPPAPSAAQPAVPAAPGSSRARRFAQPTPSGQ